MNKCSNFITLSYMVVVALFITSFSKDNGSGANSATASTTTTTPPTTSPCDVYAIEARGLPGEELMRVVDSRNNISDMTIEGFSMVSNPAESREYFSFDAKQKDSTGGTIAGMTLAMNNPAPPTFTLFNIGRADRGDTPPICGRSTIVTTDRDPWTTNGLYMGIDTPALYYGTVIGGRNVQFEYAVYKGVAYLVFRNVPADNHLESSWRPYQAETFNIYFKSLDPEYFTQ